MARIENLGQPRPWGWSRIAPPGPLIPRWSGSVLTPPVDPNAGWRLTPESETVWGRGEAEWKRAKARDLARQARERQDSILRDMERYRNLTPGERFAEDYVSAAHGGAHKYMDKMLEAGSSRPTRAGWEKEFEREPREKRLSRLRYAFDQAVKKKAPTQPTRGTVALRGTEYPVLSGLGSDDPVLDLASSAAERASGKSNKEKALLYMEIRKATGATPPPGGWSTDFARISPAEATSYIRDAYLERFKKYPSAAQAEAALRRMDADEKATQDRQRLDRMRARDREMARAEEARRQHANEVDRIARRVEADIRVRREISEAAKRSQREREEATRRKRRESEARAPLRLLRDAASRGAQVARSWAEQQEQDATRRPPSRGTTAHMKFRREYLQGVDGETSYPILTDGGESAEALVDRLTEQAIWKLRSEAGLEGGDGLGFIALIGAALGIVSSIVQAQQQKKAADQAKKLAAAQSAAEAALIKAQQQAEDQRMKNELELIAARDRASTSGAGGLTWLPYAAAGVGVIGLIGVLALRGRK